LLHAARRLALAVLAARLVAAAPAAAVTIQFDYSYDSAQFFGTDAAPSPARAVLEFAARAFEAFTDDLAAIQPGGGNSWTATFLDPATGLAAERPNLAIPAGVVHVFAASRNLPDATIGEAAPGALKPPSGSPAFVAAATNRAQGAANVDFGPWGGYISFDSLQSDGNPRRWHYDVGAPPLSGTYDLYTVAVHELGHLLGFGTSSAYGADVSAGALAGPAVQDLYGGPASVSGQHWALGVSSPPFGGPSRPRPSLGPMLAPGERKAFTPLDYAALVDLGWQAPPELLRLPGDVDRDDDVDGADFLTWQRGLGGFGGTPGDANGDLLVDDYDGWIIQNFLGAWAGVAPTAVEAPEPGTLSGLAVAALALLAGKRRSAHGSRRRRPTAPATSS
jgi:hypothetical protein